MTAPKKNETAYHETCNCPNDECGKNFDHPIQLTVLSSKPVETYPACPYCMSRIDTRAEEQEELEEPEPEKRSIQSERIKAVMEKEKEKIETKDTVEHKCNHGFGYLKKRPKGTPIPDECFVCQKMIQCST